MIPKGKCGILRCTVSSLILLCKANQRKRIDLVTTDFKLGGVSLWELGQVRFFHLINSLTPKGLDYFYELLWLCNLSHASDIVFMHVQQIGVALGMPIFVDIIQILMIHCFKSHEQGFHKIDVLTPYRFELYRIPRVQFGNPMRRFSFTECNSPPSWCS